MQLTRSLLRGLSVLEAMAEIGGPVGPGKLAEMTDLDKATVSRLLATFAHAGYVVAEPGTGQSRLTSRVLQLSRGFLDHFDLRTLARPHLAALRDTVNETAHLGVLDGTRVVYIDKLESGNSVRLVSAVGQTMPVHTTALGKAMLATLPEQDRARFVGALDPTRGPSSAASARAALLDDLRVTAERGWSIDDAENEPNVVCVGAAIVDPGGAVVGAISISGPQFRMEHRLEEFGVLCRNTAASIAADVPAGALTPAVVAQIDDGVDARRV